MSSPSTNAAIKNHGQGDLVAVVQLVSGLNVEANLLEAAQQIERASVAGAKLVMLPESFAVFGDPQMLEHGVTASQAKKACAYGFQSMPKLTKYG